MFIEDILIYIFPVDHAVIDFLERQNERHEQLRSTLISFLLICCVEETKVIQNKADLFFNEIPIVVESLIKDANFMLGDDPAAKSLEEVIISYPGFYAIATYRLANILYKIDVPLLPRMMSEIAHSKTGIDLNAGAKIGSPFFIDHGTGIVIGETAIIGNNVKIFQGVTIGALMVKKEDSTLKRHPTIEDGVVLYAGCTILGGNTVIGHDSVIGGNTWITSSVPALSVVFHNPSIIIKTKSDFSEPLNFII